MAKALENSDSLALRGTGMAETADQLDNHRSSFEKARDLVARGKLHEGLAILSRIMEESAGHFETLKLTGDLFEQLRQEPEARLMWDLALRQRPADTDLLEKLKRPHPPDLLALKKSGHCVDCSIVIPVFNQLRFTKRCLELLQGTVPQECHEVIVVDNNSTDGTPFFLNGQKHVRVIRNEENLGFATACNQGAAAASSEMILFLNNDVEVLPGWLAPLVLTLLLDSSVAVVGGKLLFPNGGIQHAGVVTLDNRAHKISLNPWHIYYKLPGTHPDANIPREFSAVTAACLLTRKSVFESLGGFDEGFRNGFEDVDYCYKVKAAGHKVVYRPESVGIHFESQSGPERHAHELQNVIRLIARWKGKVSPDVRKLDNQTIEILRPFKTYQAVALAPVS